MKNLDCNVAEKGEKYKREASKRGEGILFSLLMKLKILSWNVRGANDVVERKVIKAFLQSQKVEGLLSRD